MMQRKTRQTVAVYRKSSFRKALLFAISFLCLSSQALARECSVGANKIELIKAFVACQIELSFKACDGLGLAVQEGAARGKLATIPDALRKTSMAFFKIRAPNADSLDDYAEMAHKKYIADRGSEVQDGQTKSWNQMSKSERRLAVSRELDFTKMAAEKEAATSIEKIEESGSETSSQERADRISQINEQKKNRLRKIENERLKINSIGFKQDASLPKFEFNEMGELMDLSNTPFAKLPKRIKERNLASIRAALTLRSPKPESTIGGVTRGLASSARKAGGGLAAVGGVAAAGASFVYGALEDNKDACSSSNPYTNARYNRSAESKARGETRTFLTTVDKGDYQRAVNVECSTDFTDFADSRVKKFLSLPFAEQKSILDGSPQVCDFYQSVYTQNLDIQFKSVQCADDEVKIESSSSPPIVTAVQIPQVKGELTRISIQQGQDQNSRKGFRPVQLNFNSEGRVTQIGYLGNTTSVSYNPDRGGSIDRINADEQLQLKTDFARAALYVQDAIRYCNGTNPDFRSRIVPGGSGGASPPPGPQGSGTGNGLAR